MMRYLTFHEAFVLHDGIIDSTGGASGIRDIAALESALAQPKATFGGIELYPDIISKAAALGFFIVANHPFMDGNKRLGHAAMEVFLVLNGYEIEANSDEQEQIILAVASGQLKRAEFEKWVSDHIKNFYENV